ncbi:MAG TPA: hybrid sensor histidine kinase/response regulator [Dehalococcoidia bacterium]|nr:hybrid sensor histidine kinase/response regulator [Dehalococcoidia bacterium]
MSILVVDDSPQMQLLLATLLADAGYSEVITAGSADQAFAILNSEGDGGTGTEIDLVLMDVLMPETDGLEACRRMKAMPSASIIPIILMTGQHDDKCLEQAFESGAMDYVAKPLNQTELRSRVRSALALKHEMDQNLLANIQLSNESLAKSQILATATHELKSPLTSIVGYVDSLLLQQDSIGPLNRLQTEFLLAVQRNSHRLRTLIEELLDVSRIESGSLEFSLEKILAREVIDEVVLCLNGQSREKSMNLQVKIKPDLAPIWADSLRFGQIITNLLSNAIKYSGEGSDITIAAEDGPTTVRFMVSDTGVGIAEDDQARLFDKFFRIDNRLNRQESGTGLGLFITRYLVEAQGGSIQVQSKPNEGTTFSFILPRFDPADRS